jgi:hypothetical protein
MPAAPFTVRPGLAVQCSAPEPPTPRVSVVGRLFGFSGSEPAMISSSSE